MRPEERAASALWQGAECRPPCCHPPSRHHRLALRRRDVIRARRQGAREMHRQEGLLGAHHLTGEVKEGPAATPILATKVPAKVIRTGSSMMILRARPQHVSDCAANTGCAFIRSDTRSASGMKRSATPLTRAIMWAARLGAARPAPEGCGWPVWRTRAGAASGGNTARPAPEGCGGEDAIHRGVVRHRRCVHGLAQRPADAHASEAACRQHRGGWG